MHSRFGKHRRRKFASTIARDEYSTWIVNPNLLDRRIVEIPLQRTKARNGIRDRSDQLCSPYRCRKRTGRAVRTRDQEVVDDLVDQCADGINLGERIDRTLAQQRARERRDMFNCFHTSPKVLRVLPTRPTRQPTARSDRPVRVPG